MQTATILRFGDHHQYEGDSPWWTIRFEESLPVGKRKAVLLVVTQASRGALELDEWHDRQVQMDAANQALDTAEQRARFYRHVDLAITKLHGQFPIFAIFFRGGEGLGKGSKLTELDDDALRALGG